MFLMIQVKLTKEEGWKYLRGIESYHRMNLNESDPKTGTEKNQKVVVEDYIQMKTLVTQYQLSLELKKIL